MLAYAQSKTANVLVAVEYDQRWHDRGVRAFAVHPGLVPGTNLGLASKIPRPVRYLLGSGGGVVVINALRWVGRQVHGDGDKLKTPAQAGGTVLWTALDPELDGQGGVYCEDCHVAAVETDPDVQPWAIDPDKAKRLWELSEQMIATHRSKHGRRDGGGRVVKSA